MRQSAVFSLVMGLIVQTFPTVAQARRDEPKHFGAYLGTHALAARNGATALESATSIEIDRHGLLLGVGVDGEQRPWKIRYAPESLVTTLEDGRVRVGVRHKSFARGFAFLLQFDAGGTRRAKVVRVARADGSLLGEYHRIDARLGRAALEDQWVKHHALVAVERPLSGINEAVDLMEQGPLATDAKRAWLANLKADYRDFDDRHVRHFQPLVLRALLDPGLRLEALRVLGRAPHAGAVRALVDLADRTDLDAVTADQLTVTLGYFLYHANQVIDRRQVLRARFGTDNTLEIWDQLGGVLPVEDPIALEVLGLNQPRRRAWINEHRDRLREALGRIETRAPNSAVRTRAAQTLIAWDTNFCATRLAASGPR